MAFFSEHVPVCCAVRGFVPHRHPDFVGPLIRRIEPRMAGRDGSIYFVSDPPSLAGGGLDRVGRVTTRLDVPERNICFKRSACCSNDGYK